MSINFQGVRISLMAYAVNIFSLCICCTLIFFLYLLQSLWHFLKPLMNKKYGETLQTYKNKKKTAIKINKSLKLIKL